MFSRLHQCQRRRAAHQAVHQLRHIVAKRSAIDFIHHRTQGRGGFVVCVLGKIRRLPSDEMKSCLDARMALQQPQRLAIGQPVTIEIVGVGRHDFA